MSIKVIKSTLSVLFVLTCTFSFGQQKTETETYKSDCFSGKVEVTLTAPGMGEKDGRLEVKFPKSANIKEVFWITHDGAVRKRSVANLKSGYYHLLIVDQNDCTTKINNIHLTESK
jgi:hypothetical protein